MNGVLVSPAAFADVQAQYDYYRTIDADLAERWLRRIDETFERIIGANPHIGALGRFRSRHLQDLRRHPVRGFRKHLVFYRIAPQNVLIVRVLHGARDIEAIIGD